MSDYTQFYLDNVNTALQLECIEINHGSFPSPLRFVKNDMDGITAAGNFYEYKLMSIKRSNVTNDLDQKLSITIEDFDSHIFDLFVAIDNLSFQKQKPTFQFLVFRDDRLDEPMESLQILEIANVSKDASGAITFTAQAPELNGSRTGKTYSIEEYPLLRGV